MSRIAQLEQRVLLLEKVLAILEASTAPMTARDIAEKLATMGLNVSKKEVNSVLFSEGRRYVVYDKQLYSYSLMGSSEKDVVVNLGVSTNKSYSNNRENSPQVYQPSLSNNLTLRNLHSRALYSIKEQGSNINSTINSEQPFIKALIADYQELGIKALTDSLVINFAKSYVSLVNGVERQRIDDFLDLYSNNYLKSRSSLDEPD